MSTWDERADDYAVRHHTYEHLAPDENVLGYNRFADGARWQREELRSDETIERVADVLEQMDGLDLWDVARAALTAAIEGDE